MIFGEFRRDGGSGFGPALRDLSYSGALTRFLPADSIRHFDGEKVTLIQHTVWNTEESLSDHGPLRHAESGVVVCAWARIDNREDLAPHLDLVASDSELPDIRFILGAYLKWGLDCPSHLVGDFAFAIWDPGQGRLFCARDPMGARPFYYFLEPDRMLFAGTLAVFASLPEFPLDIEREWMARYLARLSMSFTATPYRGVLKLAPGEALSVGLEGHVLRRYHRFDGETRLSLKRGEEYVEVYRAQLEESIRCRLRSAYKLGAELSGGIDSSTITVHASRMLDRPSERLHAFGFASLEKEREYIESVSNATPLASMDFFRRAEPPRVDPIAWRCERMDRAIAILGYPIEHNNGFSFEPFFNQAESLGVRTLLSGFGGDEFVTNPGNLAMTQLFHERRYRAFLRNSSGNVMKRYARLGKWLMMPSKAAISRPHFERAMVERLPFIPLTEASAAEYGIRELYLEKGRLEDGYTDLNAYMLGNRLAPFIPTRMENCTLMAAARKIEYRWPLLDARLIQLFLSIPPEEKYYQGIGRYLHRRAIDGIVPGKVTWKQGKSMGEPVEERDLSAFFTPSRNGMDERLADLVDWGKLALQSANPPVDFELLITQKLHWNFVNWMDRWLKALAHRESRQVLADYRMGAF